MGTIYIDIKTVKGIYRVRKPLGRIGAIHFGILTKYIHGDNKEETMSPAQREAIGDGYIEWTEKVLPKIFVSFTPVGQTEPDPAVKVDDMTGEDQFAIFAALLSLIETGEEGSDYFQIV